MSSQPKAKTKKLKKIKQLFRVEGRVYFHHEHGTYVYKNRKKLVAVWSSGLLMFSGCFLLIATYVIPLVQNTSYLQSRQSSSQPSDTQLVESDDQKISPISRNNSELEVILNNKIAEFPTDQKWSVYVYSLKNDSAVEINTDVKQDAASLYKLFLLETLEEKLPFDQWYNTWLVSENIQDCVYSMLQNSDDPCSEDLANYLDLKNVDDYNRTNGFDKTSFSSNLGKQTTAGEVGKLIVDLKKGQSLSDKARRFVFDALYQQQINKGISKGCSECRTANKQGELSGVAYDAGVVTHGKQSYVLVAMTKGGSFKQITELTKTVDKFLIK